MKPAIFNRRAIPEGAAFAQWQARDGWQLRRLDWPQPDGSPARGSLFFTGGRGDFAEKYLEALAHWHDRGWHVTSFDWRGQGGSRGDIVGGNFEDFGPLVLDCADFLTAWAAERPGPHAAIAHSMGGHILLRAIAEHAPPIDAAVLVAPMLGLNSGPLPGWAAPFTASVLGLLYGRAAASVEDRRKIQPRRAHPPGEPHPLPGSLRGRAVVEGAAAGLRTWHTKLGLARRRLPFDPPTDRRRAAAHRAADAADRHRPGPPRESRRDPSRRRPDSERRTLHVRTCRP